MHQNLTPKPTPIQVARREVKDADFDDEIPRLPGEQSARWLNSKSAIGFQTYPLAFVSSEEKPAK